MKELVNVKQVLEWIQANTSTREGSRIDPMIDRGRGQNHVE
jgi:hypothetical protein